MEFKHKSVLLEETIEGLAIKPNGIYVDGTLGGGGHSYEICKRLSAGGRLIGIDQDEDAIAAAGKRLEEFADRVTIVRSNYCNIQQVLNNLGIDKVDGIVLDLGVSSYQLDTEERGFSYRFDAPLDMRMDRTAALTARDVVNSYSFEELCRILREYGEERFASRIADRIVRQRQEKSIETTSELAALVCAAMPKKSRNEAQHPARRTFQAVRIEVNGELEGLRQAVDRAHAFLNPGGRLAILTFHSLEDRIVKNAFRTLADPCTCPKSMPVCVCGKKPVVKLITRKPITASDEELEMNPRARSASLRIAEKLP